MQVILVQIKISWNRVVGLSASPSLACESGCDILGMGSTVHLPTQKCLCIAALPLTLEAYPLLAHSLKTIALTKITGDFSHFFRGQR